MEEFNKKTLIEALSSLKEHEPPNSIWENINLEMELGQEEIVSKLMIHGLPEYEPPTKVWDHISSKLGKVRTAKVIAFKWRKPLAIAASVALLLSAYFLINDNMPINPDEAQIALNYSIEEVDDMLLVKDWKDDEGDFELYQELCNIKKYVCEHPEFQVLQREFNELSDAVKELETAVGDFGTDAGLISQIKEIELERTDIFKKMMVMLI